MNTTPKNLFNVGDIVTFKTHPLFENLRIKGDSKYVPPIMIVKEVFFENKQKKTHDEGSGKMIAEKIKYLCVYFDDNKSEFIEAFLYENMLRTFEDLKFERINNNGEVIENYEDLITEVNSYPIPDYEYGKIVHFKTKKLEIYKKRSSKKISVNKQDQLDVKETINYVVNYATPDYVICGLKEEVYNDLFYNDGKTRHLAPKTFFKVKWFNPVLQKFSEQYLPDNFFTDEDIFKMNP